MVAFKVHLPLKVPANEVKFMIPNWMKFCKQREEDDLKNIKLHFQSSTCKF